MCSRRHQSHKVLHRKIGVHSGANEKCQMISLKTKRLAFDFFDNSVEDYSFCGLSSDGSTVLSKSSTNVMSFYRFDAEDPLIVRLWTCEGFQSVSRAFMSPNRRFLSFCDNGTRVIIRDTSLADPTLFTVMNNVSIAIPVSSNAKSTTYLCEQDRTLFTVVMETRESGSCLRPRAVAIAKAVVWWKWCSDSQLLVTLSRRKLVVYQLWKDGFVEDVSFPWMDSSIPTDFYVLGASDYLVACCSSDNVRFVRVPYGTEANCASVCGTDLVFASLTKTILLGYVPNRQILVIDLFGRDIDVNSVEVTEGDEWPSLVAVPSGKNLFFATDTLGYFELVFSPEMFMKKALEDVSNWRFIGHLIGGHSPFREYDLDIIDKAAEMMIPGAMVEMMCEYLVGSIFSRFEDKPFAPLFLTHRYEPLDVNTSDSFIDLQTLCSRPVDPEMKMTLNEIARTYTPERFRSTSVLYKAIQFVLTTKQDKIRRTAIPYLVVGTGVRGQAHESRSGMEANLSWEVLSRLCEISDRVSANLCKYHEQSHDFSRAKVDIFRSIIHFLVAKNLCFPFNVTRQGILADLVSRTAPEIAVLIMKECDGFQFLAPPSSPHVQSNPSENEIFEPYLAFRYDCPNTNSSTNNYAIENLRELYDIV